MAADLRLTDLECLDEIANTYLAFPDQVQDTQTGGVGESPKQAGGRDRGFWWHAERIAQTYVLTYMLAGA